jgi:hypothetical protein
MGVKEVWGGRRENLTRAGGRCDLMVPLCGPGGENNATVPHQAGAH